jgi:hypothetical protein
MLEDGAGGACAVGARRDRPDAPALACEWPSPDDVGWA